MAEVKIPQFPMGVQVSEEDMIPVAQNGTTGIVKVKYVRNIGLTIEEGGTEKTASNENLKSVNNKVDLISQAVDNSFQTVNQNFQNVENEIQSANNAIGSANQNIKNHEDDVALHVTSEKTAKWDGYATSLSENTQNITNHLADTTTAHGATSAPTANKIALRDASGILKSAISTIANASIVFADNFSVGYSAFTELKSNIALVDNTSYLLIAESIQSIDSALSGMYICSPTGGQKKVYTILNNSDITVTIDADYKVKATRVTGSSIGLLCTLIKII